MAYVDYMDPDVLCTKKANNLNHSLTCCHKSDMECLTEDE